MSGKGVARKESTAAIAAAAEEGIDNREAVRRGLPISAMNRARRVLRERADLFGRLRSGSLTTTHARAILLGEKEDVTVEPDDGRWLPALCDKAIRDLEEARSIEEVVAVRDHVEQVRLRAKQRGVAVHALNRCTELVMLAGRRIGAELAKVEKNEGGRPDKTGKKNLPVSDDALTLTELGLTKTESCQYQRLARVPADIVHEAVREANEEGREVTKAEIRRKAREADPADAKRYPGRPSAKRPIRGRGRPRKPGNGDAHRPAPGGVEDQVSSLYAWIIQGDRLASYFHGDGAEAVEAASRLGRLFHPGQIDAVRRFLDGLRATVAADGSPVGPAHAAEGGVRAAPAAS